jgi:hypothetical protein
MAVGIAMMTFRVSVHPTSGQPFAQHVEDRSGGWRQRFDAALPIRVKENLALLKTVVEQHKAIAAAHQAAAQCLASGKDEEACHGESATTCKGLAIGRFCAMKHKH